MEKRDNELISEEIKTVADGDAEQTQIDFSDLPEAPVKRSRTRKSKSPAAQDADKPLDESEENEEFAAEDIPLVFNSSLPDELSEKDIALNLSETVITDKNISEDITQETELTAIPYPEIDTANTDISQKDEPSVKEALTSNEEHVGDATDGEPSAEADVSPNNDAPSDSPQDNDSQAEAEYEEEMYSLHFFDTNQKEEEETAQPDAEPEEEEKELEPYNPDSPRKVDARFDFVELFTLTLVIVMIITSFFFRHSIVEGVSMDNTLKEGEHLIISDFFYEPDHGDIIVCQDLTTSLSFPIVKRVIALGGDSVRITSDGEVYVNDELLIEEYVYIDDPNYEYRDFYLPEVPEGEIFVMGDHRNMSDDSRIDSIGTISEDAVLGKVLLRFLPFDRFGRVD